jgi:hypothetical protein
MQCGVYDSTKFMVPEKNNTAQIPEIHDAALPDGQVGESYYVKLDCSDPDATFSLFRSSLPDGLYLTQHGEIEGTPTKAGFWHVVIMVTPEAGEEYANTKEFEITISEASDEYSLEIVEYPKKTSYKVGEKLDMTGLWVRIYTPDGFIDSRDGKDLTYSQRELVTLGEQKIKLTYKDAFEFFIVTVVAAPDPDPDTTTKPTEPDTTAKPTDPDEGSKPTNPTDGTESPTDGTESTNPTTDTTGKNDEQKPQGMPWWGILLIALATAGAGAGVTILVQKKKK